MAALSTLVKLLAEQAAREFFEATDTDLSSSIPPNS